jgi:hypothetical protein
MLIDDINLIERNYSSVVDVPFFSEPWCRIKKAALESCQQSGEAPVQQLKAAICPSCGNVADGFQEPVIYRCRNSECQWAGKQPAVLIGKVATRENKVFSQLS